MDFTDFDFDPNEGQFTDTLIFATHSQLERKLFVTPLYFDHVKELPILPVCQVARAQPAKCSPDQIKLNGMNLSRYKSCLTRKASIQMAGSFHSDLYH